MRNHLGARCEGIGGRIPHVLVHEEITRVPRANIIVD
jgi:hypothetical protein